MRIVYMGTPDFAVPPLEALYKAGHEIPFVITQPDAVRDRGRKVKFTPVKEKALELELEALQPARIRGDEALMRRLREARPDLIAVAAYGQILPPELLEIPSGGCLNVHASLLPRFRGAAPIQRAIIAGDDESGVTIMRMAEGLDTGDMLTRVKTPIGNKTGQQLHDELSRLGAELLISTIDRLGEIEPEPQDESEATYAPMLSKKEGHLDFSRPPEELERTIRAFDPWPGTYAYMGERMIKLWRSEVPGTAASGRDGEIIAAEDCGLDVVAGGHILRVTEIQMPGKKRVAVKEYLKGNSIEIGTVLG